MYDGQITVAPAESTPDLPEPSASGTLAKTPLAHLLVYAHDRELTGTFEFAGPAGKSATVLFIEGQPTKARTTEATAYLGRVLFELGILSDEQLAILLPRLLGSTELHGQVLLSEGVITEEQLELGLRAQLVRQMQALVRLPPETTFKFYDCFDGLAAYGGDGHVGIDPFPVVWACIRDEPPLEHVQLGLARLDAGGFKLAEAAETSRFAFDKSERATIELLRQKPWRLAELTAAGANAPRLVQLLVYCLLVTKQIELVRPSKLPEAAAAPEEHVEEAPPPSSSFGAPAMDPVPALTPQKVARVQLAQRPATRAPVVIEEDTSAGRLASESEDGRTSYVSTQPRSFRKRPSPRIDNAAASSEQLPPAADPSSPSLAAAPSAPPSGPAISSRPAADAATPVSSSEIVAAHADPLARVTSDPLAVVAPDPLAVVPADPLAIVPQGESATATVARADRAAAEAPPAAAILTPVPEAAPPSSRPGIPTPMVPPDGRDDREAARGGDSPTGPPDPVAGDSAEDRAAADDVFRRATPPAGMQAIEDIDPPATGASRPPRSSPPPSLAGAPPAVEAGRPAVAEVYTRPTVPKMSAVTPDQIAAFAAANAATSADAKTTQSKAGSPRPAEVKPPPAVRASPGVPHSSTIATPAAGIAAVVAPAPPVPQSGRTGAERAPTSAVFPPPASAPISSSPHAAPPASGPSPVSARPKSAPISVKEEEDEDAPPSSHAVGPASMRAMQMTAELVARKKEIQDKAASLDKDDYYAVLGVTRETPTAEIQKSFFTLAKKWHPDRVPAVLADVKDLCAKVFARMSEAHQTLTDPAKREKYDSSRKKGSDDSPEAQAQVMAILEAATNFQKAEICLKRNDFKQAEELCRKAIAVEPKQADYISMMVWLEAQKPQKQDAASMQAQVVELTRAIGISQACERAFFYRATLLKRLGQEDKAIKDFKKAMELNPRNVDAQREVRLYNMRGGASSPPPKGGKEEGGGGIFGRLFK